MKKLAIMPVAAAAITLAMTSCGGSCSQPTLKSSIDSVSYAIGVNTGLGYKENLKTFPGGEVNINDMVAGFQNALNGNEKITKDEAIKLIQTYFEAESKKEADKNKAEGDAFLEENKKKDGVITTESGLQYRIDSIGTGAIPAGESTVKVHYTGKLLDGTVFDSSVERGEPATFRVNQVIPGWTEALQLMPVGSKWTLFIPSDLAYGPRQASQEIKANSTLIFEVELLGIEPEAAKKK